MSPSSKGSLREPLIKVMSFMRAMEYKPFDGHRFNTFSSRLEDMTTKIGQMAFDIKTVFSFFRPDYSPSGVLQEASLVSPEAQQYMTPTVIVSINNDE